MNNSSFTTFLETLCDDKVENNENICLISGLPLEENYIKLYCNHTFNYKYIYNEIKTQKINPNHLEVVKLKMKQIKCPYCRKIQNHLLPNRNNYQSINGVNYPVKFCMKPYNCKAIFKSGNRKGQICSRPCRTEYCSYHQQRNLLVKKTQKNKCCFILTRGKNKGKQCSRNAKTNMDYCTQHLKMINNNPLVNIENVSNHLKKKVKNKKVFIKKNDIALNKKLLGNVENKIIDLTNSSIDNNGNYITNGPIDNNGNYVKNNKITI